MNSIYSAESPIINVYYCSISTCFNIPREILPQSEKVRIDAIANERKRSISAASYLLLMYAARKERGIYEFEIMRTDMGKPYIRDNPFYFNYSHTGDSAVCAISEFPIGIDLEKPRPYNPRTAKRVCTVNELQMLETETGDKKERLFCKMWVAKEAYSKMTGNGFSEGFRSIDTIAHPNIRVFPKKNTGEFIGIAMKCGRFEINTVEVACSALLQNNPKIYNSF